MLTNIYPIRIEFDEFNIFRINYEYDLLKELRRNYNKDYSFFRNGDFIYISSDTEESLNIGEEVVTLKTAESEKVISSLIKHIFFRTFIKKGTGIIPLDFYPFSFVSRIEEHNVIASFLPDDLKNKIGFKRQVEIQFRLISINNEPTHCAVYNIFHKWVFQVNCLELFQEGFDIRKLDVVHSVPISHLEGIIAPDETLVGTVQSAFTFQDDICVNVITNEGITQYPAKELFLEKTIYNIESYLTFRLGKAITQKVFQKITESKLQRFNAKSLQKEIQTVANAFSKFNCTNQDGFCFNISNSAEIPDNSFQIYEPVFIFDDDDGQKNKNPYFGIESFGPVDKSHFIPKQLTILVICHAYNRATFANFIANFEKGIPTSRYFKSGFLGKYRLHSIKFQLEDIQDYSIQSYKNKINNYLKAADEPNIVILETKQEFKNREALDNPYYQVKAHLLSLGIPVQFVTNDNIYLNRNSESFFNILSLQIYSKLGGTPWALPNRRSYDKEIVIGIGSYLERSNKFRKNATTKVVGITTVFSGEGRYLLGNKCSEVDYDDYFNELLIRLRASIKEISNEYNWQEGSTILVIFHIFKPIKNVEAQVVEKLISEFTQYRIKYAFVTISDNHPFLLFDSSQQGNYQSKKGEFLPEKGTNLILNEHSCLLQAKSTSEIKTSKQGFPKPLLIKITPSENLEINFRDLNHITQQIYHFLNLSFRSFETSRMPVTIFYSDLIAKLLANLKKVGGWKPEVVNTDLKRKKWFL